MWPPIAVLHVRTSNNSMDITPPLRRTHAQHAGKLLSQGETHEKTRDKGTRTLNFGAIPCPFWSNERKTRGAIKQALKERTSIEAGSLLRLSPQTPK